MQWWYTCRKESCLQDFFITMKMVSMKSRICFGMVKRKRSERERERGGNVCYPQGRIQRAAQKGRRYTQPSSIEV